MQSLAYSAASFDTGYGSQAGSPARHLPDGLGLGYAKPASDSEFGPPVIEAIEGHAFRDSHFDSHNRTWSDLHTQGLTDSLAQAQHGRMPSAPAASLRNEQTVEYHEPVVNPRHTMSHHSSPDESLHLQSGTSSDSRHQGLALAQPPFPWHYRGQTPTPPLPHPGVLYGSYAHSGVDGLAMASQGLPYSLRATPSISESSTDRGVAAEEIATMSVHKHASAMLSVLD